MCGLALLVGLKKLKNKSKQKQKQNNQGNKTYISAHWEVDFIGPFESTVLVSYRLWQLELATVELFKHQLGVISVTDDTYECISLESKKNTVCTLSPTVCLFTTTLEYPIVPCSVWEINCTIATVWFSQPHTFIRYNHTIVGIAKSWIDNIVHITHLIFVLLF